MTPKNGVALGVSVWEKLLKTGLFGKKMQAALYLHSPA